MICLSFESRLAAAPETVWASASTMAGVNAELGPWVRMSYPAERAALDAQAVPLGELLFQSWLCVFGLIPFDRHALVLEQLYPGIGFDERSSSWMQKVWVHRRRIEAIPGGCRVSDELEIAPRLRLQAPLVRWLVAALFRHRHRRLRARYGALAG
ncbi:hypothetical protein ED208_01935 [Stagnimonas aquatica]|uniref:SRPBCC family protein n=1 Tax=Stagnimonas aquatica TaxID=2689987 RepID=A0A3N0VKK5_9GAMM|nr:hypothetical protein [Stagnimonas aquatica]ROH93307.1 hypothetical protein ED208_01935 [Stagnimonas aquatica]